MKKYLIAGGVVVVIAGIYLLMPSEKVSNPIASTMPEPKQEKKSSNFKFKNVEVQEAKNSKPAVHKEVLNEKPKVASSQNSSHLVNRDALKETSQKISNFIDENGLQSIQSVGDVEIFAKNPPQHSEFAPPMPPTLIKVKFKDKEKLVPLNSDLVSANKKVYVVEKRGDNYSQIKEIDTKKLTSFTPPTIGQN